MREPTLENAHISHLAQCSMCNGAWNDGPCTVGLAITKALTKIERYEVALRKLAGGPPAVNREDYSPSSIAQAALRD